MGQEVIIRDLYLAYILNKIPINIFYFPNNVLDYFTYFVMKWLWIFALFTIFFYLYLGNRKEILNLIFFYTFPFIVKNSHENNDLQQENIERSQPISAKYVSLQMKKKNQEKETLQIKILKVPDNIGLQIKILGR